VAQAVQSALNQTLSKNLYEIILTKNFSTSFDEEWSKKGVKILYFNERGQGIRVKHALSYCRGKVIAFLDDDDLWAPRKLERVFEVFSSDPNVVYYHNGICVFGKNLAPRRLSTSGCYNSSCMSIRKDILNNNLVYLEKIKNNIDVFFWVVAGISGGKMVFDNKPLTYYRIDSFRLGDRKKHDDIFERMVVDSGNKAFAEQFFGMKLRHSLVRRAFHGERMTLAELTNYVRTKGWLFNANEMKGLFAVAIATIMPNVIRMFYLRRNNIN
jgi:glycosyltransferase involved in cell wall biosynthesis